MSGERREYVIPLCKPDHSGNSGPYCDHCNAAEGQAFEDLVAIRTLCATVTDDVELASRVREIISTFTTETEVV